MEEIWKDVVGYERYYKVSNFGNVYSVRRNKQLKTGNKHRNGYLQVNLYINGKYKTLTVHRLVAQAFIPNPYEKQDVNHKDENKTNNRVDNLEWLTRKENNNYGTRNIRCSKRIKVIYQDDTYEVWDSITEFSNEFGFSSGGVCNVLRGTRKTYHGMKFEYLEGERNAEYVHLTK